MPVRRCGPGRQADILGPQFETPRPLLQRCKQDGFQSISAIPIRSKKQVLGIFNLFFHEPHVFDSHEILLLETIGQHLGVAIESQRLVSREKEMAISEERNLLAQELHDSIAQGLAFLNIQVQMLEDSLRTGATKAKCMEGLAQIREGVQESYDDVRELLVHFRTRVHQSDLEGAIRGALEKFEGQTGIKTNFRHERHGCAARHRNTKSRFAYRAGSLVQCPKTRRCQRRDGGSLASRRLRISVRDNGRGFDPEPNPPGDSHVGISIMKERAHRIGGQLEILSTPEPAPKSG